MLGPPPPILLVFSSHLDAPSSVELDADGLGGLHCGQPLHLVAVDMVQRRPALLVGQGHGGGLDLARRSDPGRPRLHEVRPLLPHHVRGLAYNSLPSICTSPVHSKEIFVESYRRLSDEAKSSRVI